MRKLTTYLMLLLTVVIMNGFLQTAHAVTGAEFQAGKIIDDSVFFNPGSIDSNSIQTFLNSKVPVCDTNGTQAYGGTTRAAYGTSKGYAPPFTCLKDFTENTPVKLAETGLCGQYNGGAKSAARIIYDVAQSCGISPKVLIVLLEKEQSLVTDDWPWSIQYRSATGYGCPDTAACDAEYYGYFNQVFNAARQFKRYARDANLFSYRAGRSNYIQYNPNAGCGGSNILIQNQATAGLYNYTPYQPNAAALSNVGGMGDGCSAYGNRNFWKLFNNWFGSTTFADCTFPPFVNNGIYRLYSLTTGNHLLTNSPAEVCIATALGLRYDGQLFMANSSGSKPVYRLQKDGRYLFTISTAERDFAVQSYGYQLEGIAFYAVDEASDPTNARPLYRLSSTTGAYVYTISSAEKDSLVKSGYNYEGIGFYLKENPGAAVTPAYRLHSSAGAYLYTISTEERDVASQFYGYQPEGVGFNAITQLNPISTPIYRLETKHGFLITTSLAERAAALRVGYRDKGISMFTYGVDAPELPQVFRLHHPNGSYLFTTSASEAEWAARNAWYVKEGVGFRTP